MNNKVDVLERSVLQPGKAFIQAGEENIRAYVIQKGEVHSFLTHNNVKIPVGRYGPGTIIGELSLMVDTFPSLSYEALTTTTVITITRQDFQKRLVRADKTIRTILDHAIKKLENYEDYKTKQAINDSNIDSKASLVMDGLLKSVPPENQEEFRKTLLPHINGLIQGIKKYQKK